MKKTIALLLCVLTLFQVTSCTKAPQTNVETTNSTTTAGQITPEPFEQRIDLAEYVFYVPQNKTVSRLFRALLADIKSETGIDIERITEGDLPNENVKAVIVAPSDEVTSAISSVGYTDGAAILRKNNRIFVYGTNDDALLVAYGRFANMIKCEDGHVYCDVPETTLVDTTGNEVQLVKNKVIRTEFKSVIYQPTKENPNVTLTYPKIVMLEHSGDNNGTLFATAESLDVDCFIIHKSTDGGRTWKQISRITAKEKGMVANWQPFLYELPCAVGDMPEGTLLFAGCIRDYATSVKTEMVVWKSTDLGESWEKIAIVAEGKGGDQGLWEPVLYAEEGKLYCFYSDETDKINHSQMLVLKTSENGLDWSDRVEVVACKQQSLRPGMLTLTKMGNGEYFIAYEMVGIDGNPIYCKTTTDLDDWGNVSDYGDPVKTVAGVSFGSSPACTWTPLGGENGTLIVTAKHEWGGSSKTGTDWLVSFDYGKTWKNMDNPLPYTPSDSHRYAYSPGLFTASDGSVYYVNDINCTLDGFEDKASVTLAHIIIE